MLKMRGLLVLILIIATGCATIESISHPTKNMSERQMDSNECQRISGYQGGGGFIFGPAIIVLPILAIAGAATASAQQAYIECMRKRGYAVKVQGEK